MALARVGSTQQEIATRVGVTHAAVNQWLSGQTRPSAQKRQTIAGIYGIAPDLWEHATSDPPAPERPAPAAERDHAPRERAPRERPADGVLGKAHRLEQMAHELMERVQADPNATPLEQARVMASVAATLNLIAKITGQFELGARIMRLPMWRKIERAIADALQPFPEAAAAVAEAMRRLEDEHSRTH
jgi:transcriptional regulator with XRE-family HTH domain